MTDFSSKKSLFSRHWEPCIYFTFNKKDSKMKLIYKRKAKIANLTATAIHFRDFSKNIFTKI